MKRHLPWASDASASVRQNFEYERRAEPPLSVDLMRENAESPIKGLQYDLPAMAAAKAPAEFGVGIYPHYGVEALENLPNSLIALQKQATELPVLRAEAKTQVQQQAQAQKYLSWINNAKAPNGDDLELWKYNTAVSNGSVNTPQFQYSPLLGGYTNLGPDGKPAPTQSGGTGDSVTVDNTGQTFNIQSGTSPQANPTTFNLQSGQTSAAPASSATAPSPAVTSTTPLDSVSSLASRNHFDPEEALAWYKANVYNGSGPQAPISARQEFSMASGYPVATPRNIIQLKSGVEQPVHSDYIAANAGAGEWRKQMPTPVNPALAAPPMVPPSPQIAQAISDQNNQAIGGTDTQPIIGSQVSPLLRTAMEGTQQTPAQVLAAGDPRATSQLIADLAGPQWAAANGAQAPLYKNAPWLNQPNGVQHLPSAPSVLPTPSFTPTYSTNPSPQLQAQHANTNQAAGSEYKSGYGLSAQELLAQAQSKDAVHLGTDNSNPIGGQPAEMIGIHDALHNPGVMYVDPASAQRDANGNLIPDYKNTFTKTGVLPYGDEFRTYLDGHTQHVVNEVTKAQDMAMMNMVVKHGLATAQAWDNWTPQQKTSAYRQAFSADDENAKTYPEVNKQFANEAAVLTTGQQLQSAVDRLNAPGDPDGLKARGYLAGLWNQAVNKFGGPYGVKDNPNLSEAQATYTAFMDALHDMRTSRPPTSADRLGIGDRDSGNLAGSLGDLGDEHFSANSG